MLCTIGPINGYFNILKCKTVFFGRNIYSVQSIQVCATKLVISIKNLTYKDRLKRLKKG